jgi:drug/metabolite transporter (DMT)-like permease
VQIALALVLTIISACALDLGYLLQHDVASRLPPLSVHQPIKSVRSLLVERRWLAGFGIQVAGFALYVVALAYAPLSLVQATAAGGIGILAIMVSRITHVPLTRLEKIGAAVSVVGLALLGISLVSSHGEGSGASYFWIAVWLGASAGAAALCVTLLGRAVGVAAAWGIASGILFAAGDVATKMAVSGGAANIAFLVCLVVFYAAGTAVLQAAFQRGSALTTAGLSTLLTNALPILAGMIVFHEPLPSGWVGAVRIAAFAAVIAGAVLLGTRSKDASQASADAGRSARRAGIASAT